MLTLAVGIIAIFKGRLDARRADENRRRQLEDRIGAANETLARTGTALLDRLETLPAPSATSLRSLAAGDPLCAGVWRLEEDRLLWPRPAPVNSEYAMSLWRRPLDAPAIRRLFETAWSARAEADLDAALVALDGIIRRSREPASRVEARLQRADILLDERPTESLAECDALLADLVASEAEGGAMSAWAVAARFRRIEILDALGTAARSASAETSGPEHSPDSGSELSSSADDARLDLLGLLLEEAHFNEHTPFSQFFIDPCLARLRESTEEGRLDSSQQAALERLAALRETLDEESRLVADLERFGLRRLAATPAGEDQRLALGPEGDRSLIVRRAADGETIGFVEDGSIARRLLEATFARLTTDWRGAKTSWLGTRGAHAVEQKPGLEVLPAGDGLPWTVLHDWSAERDSRLAARTTLYSALVLGFLVMALTVACLLVRSHSRAAAASQARAHFVANVSHELKTPLTLIRLSAEMLLHGYSRDEAGSRRNLETIDREAQNLDRLIDNVLLLSRLDQADASRPRIDPVRIEFGVFLDELLASWLPWLERRGFDVETRVSENLPAIDVDPSALERIFGNLLSNAVKYSPDRKELELRAHHDNDNSELVVEVADRGIGIDEGESTALFERFRRGAEAASRGLTGTGLGLSIVREAVEAHGGTVAARARDGGGSVFVLRFPEAGADVGSEELR